MQQWYGFYIFYKLKMILPKSMAKPCKDMKGKNEEGNHLSKLAKKRLSKAYAENNHNFSRKTIKGNSLESLLSL